MFINKNVFINICLWESNKCFMLVIDLSCNNVFKEYVMEKMCNMFVWNVY